MSLLAAHGFWCMQQIVQFIASIAVDEAESAVFFQTIRLVIALCVIVVVVVVVAGGGVIVVCLLLLRCGITLVAIGFYTCRVGLCYTRPHMCTTALCNTWPPHLCGNIRFMFVMPFVFHVCISAIL